MSELKPCPFCGEIPQVGFRQIFCKNHSCRINTTTCDTDLDGDCLSDAEILKNWNTRPFEDALRAERDTARAEVERLRAALEVYAYPGNWGETRGGQIIWNTGEDGFSVARRALEAKP